MQPSKKTTKEGQEQKAVYFWQEGDRLKKTTDNTKLLNDSPHKNKQTQRSMRTILHTNKHSNKQNTEINENFNFRNKCQTQNTHQIIKSSKSQRRYLQDPLQTQTTHFPKSPKKHIKKPLEEKKSLVY